MLELSVIPTNQVPFIGDYVRIVCAISNRYFPALGRTVMTYNWQEKCNRSLQRYYNFVVFFAH